MDDEEVERINEALVTVRQLRQQFIELDSTGGQLEMMLEGADVIPGDKAVVESFVSRANQVLEKKGLRPPKRDKRVRTTDAKYSSPVFKCHDDYNRCLKKKGSRKLCIALFTICIGRQLIPFVK
jgi:hypothetical protein